MKTVCSAGGVIWKEDAVLLVRVTYGANKNGWMVPGGMVEEGETLERTAVREVLEETGIEARPVRLIGVRSGIRDLPGEAEHGVHFIFEMEWVSGTPTADGTEIAEARFVPVREALNDPAVVGLTQEIVRACRNRSPEGGLIKLDRDVRTNQSYRHYDVYTLA